MNRAVAFLDRLRIPFDERSPAVRYSPSLVTYVAALLIGSVTWAVLSFSSPPDMATFWVGVGAVGVTALLSSRSLAGVSSAWSSPFLHLGLTLLTGPIGAVGGAVADASGMAFRSRASWFRSLFNFGCLTVSQLTALQVFTALTHHWSGGIATAAATTAAGVSQYCVNEAAVAMVIYLASGRRASLRELVREPVYFLPFGIGYGWATFGFLLLHSAAGALGFTAMVVPALLLQGFLLYLSIRVHQHDAAQAAHAKEREGLLNQAIEASEEERKRIASDLHDGVVQTLAGLAFSLSAASSATEGTTRTTLGDAAETLRTSVTELRTLMIAIAPPDLSETGMRKAIDKLMDPVRSKGIEVQLAISEEIEVTPERTTLLFRVAQEAVRNIINHSGATSVTVRLTSSPTGAQLDVTDNGKGFSMEDRERRRQEGHVGLSLLTNAVRAAGGSLDLVSEPGRGTSLILGLP